MLPSLLARDVQNGLKQFLLHGFEPSDDFFHGLMQRFVDEESAWMKGPYLQIGLPFRVGAAGRKFFGHFETQYPSYVHQEAAWLRLASNQQAANTLVATGTGSGKTECFLYPLLDHASRTKAAGEQGVKALVIYPMNALASDQARRIAELVEKIPAFNGLRVGLFVGGQPVAAILAAEKASSPFSGLSDHELMSVGVPEDLLSAVRKINDETDLDGMQDTLPVEAYEALFLFIAGDSISQILAARETRVDVAIDVTDFAGALDRAESQSRFVIVENDEALSAIMNAPLAQWRVFLHPTQRKLATKDFSGPARVLGGAGTGKTVLAIHRAKWLAENRTPADKRVLFTTFTKNLAIDVRDNLSRLCNAETMKKIEVINLDAWVHAFLRSRYLWLVSAHRTRSQPAPNG